MTPYLAELTAITCAAFTDPKQAAQSSEAMEFIIQNAPKLSSCRITCIAAPDEEADTPYLDLYLLFSAEKLPLSMNNLTGLDLPCVDFSKFHIPLFSSSIVVQLRNLELEACRGFDAFLHQLSETYEKRSGQLKRVYLNLYHWEDGVSNDAVEQFLTCCPSLRMLDVDVVESQLLDKDCITCHGATLDSLVLAKTFSEDGLCYSSQDLKAFLHACPRLTSIALSLPLVRLRSVTDLGESFDLFSMQKEIQGTT
jgi:hypothetical protein